MDEVYQGAEVTIIAAAGSDPTYGLPGVSRPLSQRTAKLGQQMMEWTYPLRGEIARSDWSKRGWTFQEMLFSCRRLVFTESLTFFQCYGGVSLTSVQEINPYKQNEEPYRWLLPFPSRGVGGEALDIYHRIEEYSQRKLSYDSDALNAFTGVFNAFKAFGLVHHFWGIPNFPEDQLGKIPIDASFAFGLIWRSTASRVQRRTGNWPSWTWASLKSKVEFPLRGHRFQHYDDMVIRATHRAQGDLDISDCATYQDDYSHFLPRICITSYITIAQMESPKARRQRRSHTRIVLDCDNEISEGETFNAIYLGIFDNISHGDIEVVSLLVKETEPGLFRRVGLAEHPLRGRKPDHLDQIITHSPPNWLPTNAFAGQGSWMKRSLRLG